MSCWLFFRPPARKPKMGVRSARSSRAERWRELGFVAYYGPRSLSRIGIGGPEHPEDRNTEPILDERGELVDRAPGGCR